MLTVDINMPIRVTKVCINCWNGEAENPLWLAWRASVEETPAPSDTPRKIPCPTCKGRGYQIVAELTVGDIIPPY